MKWRREKSLQGKTGFFIKLRRKVPDDEDLNPDKDVNAGGFSWHTAQYGQSRAWQEQYGGGLVALHFGL